MKAPLLFLIAILSLTGCKTTPSPALTKIFIRTATSTAVSLAIQKDPEAAPYLRATMPIICSAGTDSNFAPAEVVAALESSDAQSLKNPSAVIVINSVLAIYSAALEQYGGTTNFSNARIYLEGVCQGLHDALPAPGLSQLVKPQPHIE